MFKNQLRTIFFLGILSALFIAIGGSLGPGAFYFSVFLAIAMNFGAYFYSDKLVLAMHDAREVSPYEAPKLHQIVEELAQAAQIPKPRVFIIHQAQPNAFATGRNPEHGAVAVTEGIMQILTERELRGVLAHELAHIKNRDILIATIAAAVSSAVTYLAHALQFTALFGGGRSSDEDSPSPLAQLAIIIIAPLAATLIQLAISRSREYIADETGARICQDPNALADALAKLERGAERIPNDTAPATASLFIVNPLAGRGGVMGLFSTHPPMEERIERLRTLRV